MGSIWATFTLLSMPSRIIIYSVSTIMGQTLREGKVRCNSDIAMWNRQWKDLAKNKKCGGKENKFYWHNNGNKYSHVLLPASMHASQHPASDWCILFEHVLSMRHQNNLKLVRINMKREKLYYESHYEAAAPVLLLS